MNYLTRLTSARKKMSSDELTKFILNEATKTHSCTEEEIDVEQCRRIAQYEIDVEQGNHQVTTQLTKSHIDFYKINRDEMSIPKQLTATEVKRREDVKQADIILVDLYIIEVKNPDVKLGKQGVIEVFDNGRISITENKLKKLQKKYNVVNDM